MNNNILESEDSINGILEKDVYAMIKERSACSKDRLSGYLSTLSKKIKDCNLTNVKSFATAKQLHSIYDKGKSVMDELIVMNEYIQILECIQDSIKRIKTKNKELVNANKVLKHSLNQAEKELAIKEGKLIIIKERKRHYEQMIGLSKYEIEKELVDVEYEIWDQCIFDKMKLNFTPFLKHYKRIVEFINCCSLSEMIRYTEDRLINVPKGLSENEEIRYQKSLCYLLVSKYCYDLNYYEESLRFGMEALHQSKSLTIERPQFLSKVMACISLVLLKNNETKKSLFYVLESLKLLDSISQSDSDKKSYLADQYVKLGLIFSQSHLNKDGIELMELGVVNYSLMLPDEENRWVESLAKLGRVCNDSNFPQDTMIICEKLIVYFHNAMCISDGIVSHNRNIFDIAVDVEERRNNNNLTDIQVPTPTTLPRYMYIAISELVIIFAKNHLFAGAALLSNWLSHCQQAETDTNKYRGSKFSIKLESLDFENGFIPSPNDDDIKSTVLTRISSQVNAKSFSSKLSALLRPKPIKITNSNTDLHENHANVKKLFKIFKK